MTHLKTHLLLVVFFLGVSFQSFSQKFSAGIHTGLIHYRIVGTTNISNDPVKPFYKLADEVNANVLSICAAFKYDIPVIKFNDEMSLGLGLNLGLGFQGGNEKLLGIDGAPIIDFPEYVTFRYGDGSTPDSKKNIGYTFGLGYNYTLTTLPYQSPSILGEVNFDNMSIGINFNLLKYTYYYYYTSEGDSPAATLRPIGIKLLFHN